MMAERSKRKRLIWTDEMINSLQSRYRQANIYNSESAPRKENGRKIGYMELMHNYFLEKHPELDFLTSQILRNKVAHVEKVNTEKSSLVDTYKSQVNTNVDITNNTSRIPINDDNNYELNPMECEALIKAHLNLAEERVK